MTLARVPGMQYRIPFEAGPPAAAFHEVRLPPPSDTALVLEEGPEEQEKQIQQVLAAINAAEQAQAQVQLVKAGWIINQAFRIKQQLHSADVANMMAAYNSNDVLHQYPEQPPYIVPPIIDPDRRQSHRDSPYGEGTDYGPYQPTQAQLMPDLEEVVPSLPPDLALIDDSNSKAALRAHKTSPMPRMPSQRLLVHSRQHGKVVTS